MRQLKVKTTALKSGAYLPTPTERWIEAVESVRSEIVCNNPLSSIQAAVDVANKRGVACKATAYERREALQNALLRTEYHIDSKNRVAKLSDLISLRDVSLDVEADTPCVRFKVQAQLEGGKVYISAETLEWLDGNGNVVTKHRHLDFNVEPLVEAARALDTFMTKVGTEVYRRLDYIVPELRLEERVAKTYRDNQSAPLWAAGREICVALAREHIIPDFGTEYLGIEDAPGVSTSLQSGLNDEGIIDGTVFVVLIKALGRAGVVSERNCEYSSAVWVTASTVTEALVEYERGRQ